MMKGTKDWEITRFPDFKERKVFIVPGAFTFDAITLFGEANFARAKTVEEADVVVFLGGSDISPTLYGEKALPETYAAPERDAKEIEVYNLAKKLGKIIVGICRGAQLVHALNDGKLWQHVVNHGRSHYIVDIEEDVRVISSSMHHQMLQANDKMILCAVTEEQVSHIFKSADLCIDLSAKGANAEHEVEVEACFYKEDKSFLVQGHPEVGGDHYRSWFMHKLYDWVLECEALPTGGPEQLPEIKVTKEIA